MPAIGALSAALRYAQEGLVEVHQQIDDLLVGLFPEWRPRFPLELGWRFISPDELHIYHATETEPAIAALWRAGFHVVTVHPHDSLRFFACRCVPARSVT